MTITVTPENDLPDLADSSRSGTEAVNSSGATLISGNIAGAVSDPDPGDAHTFSSASAGTYGTFSLSSDGSFTYVLDNAHADVDQLGVGDVLVDVLSVFVDDGAGGTDTANLTITINGANDAPDLSSGVASVNERSDGLTPSTISGFLSGTDPEGTPLLFATTATAAGPSRPTRSSPGTGARAPTRTRTCSRASATRSRSTRCRSSCSSSRPGSRRPASAS